MKQLLFTLLAICISLSVSAQNQITVYGSAEKTIPANQIFLSLTIQETETPEGGKTEMKELEADLMDALAKVGISTSNVTIENISAYPSYNSNGTILTSKIMLLMLNNENQLLDLLNGLGDISVSGLSILHLTHTEWDNYMKDLKVEAILNARKEAEILAQAAGKKLGTITMLEETTDHKQNKVFSNYDSKGLQGIENFEGKIRNIGLYYSIKVTFELK